LALTRYAWSYKRAWRINPAGKLLVGLFHAIPSLQVSWSRCYTAAVPPEKDGEQQGTTKNNDESVGTAAASARMLTIPNVLTVSRMVASPFIGYWIVQEEYFLAMSWFFLASATDSVDGFIAKRFNLKSVIGSFLDPVADKLLVTIMVTTMAYKSLLPLP